jgi:hypothetical protein
LALIEIPQDHPRNVAGGGVIEDTIDEDGIRTVVEYVINEDGKKVKVCCIP